MATIPKVTVEIAFDGGPFSSSYSWTDVSDYVKGFQVKRGRNTELDRIEAGTLSLTLDNSDGRFTPGKKNWGGNRLTAFAGKYAWDLTGRANNTIMSQINIGTVDDDQRQRVMARTVYTNGKPVSCYFSVRWLDSGGSTLRWVIGTRFVADSSPAVYTHEEAPPVGTATAVLYIYADTYPEGNTGLTAYGEKAEWSKTQPYYPNVVPRRRVRVRTANLAPKDLSTGGDVSRTSLQFSTTHSPSASDKWVKVPKTGAGSISVKLGDNGPDDFASSIRCGYSSSGRPVGLARVSPNRVYAASGCARLAGTSRDVNLISRLRWYDSAGTFLSTSSAGPTLALTSERGNLVLNPSVYDLTNTQLYGSSSNMTRVRITTDAHAGSNSIEHTHIADGGSAGTTWTIEPATAGQTVSFGVWVKIPATGITAGQLAWRNGTTTLRINPISPLPAPDTWVRLSGTYTAAAGQTIDRVGIAFTGANGTKWLADACQAVLGPTLPDYGDGTFSGWRWTGEPHASPSSTTADDTVPGSWSALPLVTATAPAGAAWAGIEVGSQGGDAEASFYLDEMQLEEGDALSEWNPGGSVFHGYIEKWPVTSEGLTAEVEVTAVDGFSVLSNTDIRTAMQNQILTTKPLGYWTLGDPVGATRLENLANDLQPAKLVPSKYGGGTPLLGADSVVRKDETTCYSLANVASDQGTVVDICEGGTRIYPLSTELTVAFWCHPVYPSSGQTHTLFRSWSDNGNDGLKVQLDSSGKVIATMRFVEGISSATSTASLSSSKPSFVVVSVKSGYTSIWINGALDIKSDLGSVMDLDVRDMRWASLAGAQSRNTYAEYANGRYGHLALWDRQLSSSEISSFWKLGDYNGAVFAEDEKTRIERIADMANYQGEASYDAAKSSLQGPDWSTGASALEELQRAAEDASGYIFMDGDGRLTYHNRDRRQGAVVRYELSDSLGLPYEPGLQFEMDEDRIINEVTYKRTNGIEGVLKDQASIDAYGRKSKSIELRVTSDSEVQDAAYTLLNHYATPLVRCESVTLKASAVPALFLLVLGVEIGDRITLSDLPTQAPDSSLDYYVEAVSTDVSVDGGTLDWVTTLSLSPAENSDVWVLEDATLGRLDRTSVLAY
ncbi:fimbrial protein [Streptomyces antimicrobicus]|uniref:Fimbrial protein n=1 Tax=Streptomyces antimicrobicus TaxID=2883108 RepID=A0ABS8B4H8_9ACTN|nr:fimbrial protein [Streptomyces antimicrobicus]MCB5179510.1 fimbrial protein [Streptomyces antimicrobicus]